MSLNWWSQQDIRYYEVKEEKLQHRYRIINPNFPQFLKIRVIHQAQGRRPEGVINMLFKAVNKYHEEKLNETWWVSQFDH